MARFVAFLRAINVGRGRTVKMDSLRQLFESLGFSEVATFMASGNVVFETTTKNAKTLEGKIQRRLEEALECVVARLPLPPLECSTTCTRCGKDEFKFSAASSYLASGRVLRV